MRLSRSGSFSAVDDREVLSAGLRKEVQLTANDERAESLAIQRVVGSFFDAFTQANGQAPDVRAIKGLFLPLAVIVKCAGATREVYDLESFLVSREQILSDGTLAEFRESELESELAIRGNMAQRSLTYQKSGLLNDVPFGAQGRKQIQLVRVDGSWRIVSIV